MNSKSLIPMVNRIGTFFESQPNREESLEGIANHIRLFWDPRMRQSLFNYLDEHPDGKSDKGELSAIVMESITRYRTKLDPAALTA